MFKISDEDIMSFVRQSLEKESRERGLLREEEGQQPQQSGGVDCGEIRNFPKFEITPNWGRVGKKQTFETEVFRSIFEGVDPGWRMQNSKGQYAVAAMPYREKIELVNQFFDKEREDPSRSRDTKRTSMLRALSYIMIADVFSRLVDEQQHDPKTAGRLVEGFIAALFRGAKLFDESREILDVKINYGPDLAIERGYSLKFYAPKTASRPLKGSVANLMTHFDKNDKFVIIVMVKHKDGIEFRERIIPRPGAWSSLDSDLEKLDALEKEGLIRRNNPKYFYIDMAGTPENRQAREMTSNLIARRISKAEPRSLRPEERFLIWRQGWDSWKPATSVPEIANATTFKPSLSPDAGSAEQQPTPAISLPALPTGETIGTQLSTTDYGMSIKVSEANSVFLKLPDPKALRKKAAESLKLFNQDMSGIYEDIEYIRCYANNYFIKNNLKAASGAKDRAQKLKDKVDSMGEDG